MSPEPAPLLAFRGVNTHYGDLHVLKSVDYTIGQGEIVCLLGGNASGKTTSMNTILGLVRPTSGEIHYAGQRIDRWPTAARSPRPAACSAA
jgi:branched-chain amino acid transport system ATP-binding protein